MQIARDDHIAIYSLPGASSFWKLHQEDYGASDTFDPVLDYFVLRPFSDLGPKQYFRADVHEEVHISDIEVAFTKQVLDHRTDRSSYEAMVAKAVKLASDMQGKIVLSRIDTQERHGLRLSESLLALRKKFPQAFVYLIHSPAYGTWMGATPETLIDRYDEDFHTMALAGTKPIDEVFTQKEFDEQLLVSKDIMEQLTDVPVEVGDVHEFAYGEIKHLRTLFQWKSLQPISVFAERLHPTPAVSGYPRAKAREVIAELETHDRSLYTGYLGVMSGSGKSQLFVNLRCMQLFEEELWYYSGGGINAQSDPSREWEETEQKKKAVLSALVYEG